MCSKGLCFRSWEMPLFWYLSPSVQWLEAWALPCSSGWVLCLSELGIPEPLFLLLPSEGVHCLPSLPCSRSQANGNGSWAFVSWMKQIKVIQSRLQVAISPLAEGRNLGLEKGDHQSLFLFSKLFIVEVACTTPTVMGEHSSSFTWVPLVFAKVVLFSIFLDPLHPFFLLLALALWVRPKHNLKDVADQFTGCGFCTLTSRPPAARWGCSGVWGNTAAAAALLTPVSRKLLHGLFLWRKEINVAFPDLYFRVEFRICKTFFFLKNICMIEILS